MAKGRVKWFNDAKGFGFIERAGSPYRASGSGYPFQTLPSTKVSSGKPKSSSSASSGKPVPGSGTGAEVGGLEGDEIFVHYTAIVGDGHKTLEVGQEVEFDIYDTPKGRTAQNVVPRG